MRPHSALPIASLALLLAACSGGGGTTAPQQGTLAITANATGSDVDENGFTYSIDGGAPVAIAVGGAANIDKPAGSHTIAFSGITRNCTPTSATSFPVTLGAGQTAHIDFAATCVTRLILSAGVSGTDADFYYLVRVDSGAWHQVIPNSFPVAIPGVAPGPHQIHFRNIASNCYATAGADQPLNMVDTVYTPQFDFVCTTATRTILFGSTRDGGYDLYNMHADGTGTVRLTTGTPLALHGTYSPDGKKIAFHSPNGTGFDIWVMNFNGTGAVAITTDGGSGVRNLFPDWSPDGSMIIFDKDGSFAVMDSSGAHQHAVHAGFHARFSPDLSQIAFSADSSIYLMNVDGTNVHQIQATPGAYSAYPEWSPDGTTIVFQSDRDGPVNDIFTMNADGTNPQNVTHGAGGDTNEDQTFSPTGFKIAWRHAVNGIGNPDIWVMDYNGNNKVNIAPNAADEFGTNWHP